MRAFATILLVSFGFFGWSQSKYFDIDQSHSQIKFIGHLGGMMDVEGTFTEWNGILKYDDDLNQVSITLSIKPESVVSGNEWRDKHLKNPDFLDVEKYPALIFQSTSVLVNGTDLEVSGGLNLKGEVRQVKVPMTLAYPPSPDPWGNNRIGFEGKMLFSRKELNMGPTEGFWANGIADEFEMEFVISAAQRNTDRMGQFTQSPLKEVLEAAIAGNSNYVRDELQKLVDEGKLDAWMSSQIGHRLDEKNHLDQALMVYQLNCELFPEDASVRSRLALAYADRDDWENARKEAAKAIAINPVDPVALELLK